MVLGTVIQAGSGLSEELALLAERLRPSVVEVRSERGGGSGIIWSADGLIVTNHHVAQADRLAVGLADGRVVTGIVEQRDPEQDLAIVRVPAEELTAATIGDSTALRVGQLVVAIGNPLGVPRVVTVGMISGPPHGSHGRVHWRDAILAEIELRPGSSGGPLLDVAGRVIGINAMVIGPRTALSIPSHRVTQLIIGGPGQPFEGSII